MYWNCFLVIWFELMEKYVPWYKFLLKRFMLEWYAKVFISFRFINISYYCKYQSLLAWKHIFNVAVASTFFITYPRQLLWLLIIFYSNTAYLWVSETSANEASAHEIILFRYLTIYWFQTCPKYHQVIQFSPKFMFSNFVILTYVLPCHFPVL